jgi:hypothetical protein
VLILALGDRNETAPTTSALPVTTTTAAPTTTATPPAIQAPTPAPESRIPVHDFGAILLTTTGAENGRLWQASVLRTRFAPQV